MGALNITKRPLASGTGVHHAVRRWTTWDLTIFSAWWQPEVAHVLDTFGKLTAPFLVAQNSASKGPRNFCSSANSFCISAWNGERKNFSPDILASTSPPDPFVDFLEVIQKPQDQSFKKSARHKVVQTSYQTWTVWHFVLQTYQIFQSKEFAHFCWTFSRCPLRKTNAVASCVKQTFTERLQGLLHAELNLVLDMDNFWQILDTTEPSGTPVLESFWWKIWTFLNLWLINLFNLVECDFFAICLFGLGSPKSQSEITLLDSVQATNFKVANWSLAESMNCDMLWFTFPRWLIYLLNLAPQKIASKSTELMDLNLKGWLPSPFCIGRVRPHPKRGALSARCAAQPRRAVWKGLRTSNCSGALWQLPWWIGNVC